MTKLTNPRLHAEFTDWPLGGSKRGKCVFSVEHNPKKGYRFTRVTTGKPKVSTYGCEAAIVEGDDGKTYLIQRHTSYGFISISRSDFMTADITGGSAFHSTTPELFSELDALIGQANTPATV